MSPETEEPVRDGPYTFEQWADLPDEDRRELVDGYLEEEELTNATHELVVAWLIAMLHGWGAPRGVVVLGSGCKYVVSPRRGRMPDVAAFLPDQRKPPRVGLQRRPPGIVIEIVSSRPRDQRRDRVAKLTEYAAWGARWYWLVDPYRSEERRVGKECRL